MVPFGLLGSSDGVGQGFPGHRSSFELVERHVHRITHQLPHALGEDVGGDARVGGDPGHHPGLGDADLPSAQRVVPDPHRTAQLGLLHANVRFGTGQLQVVLHPRLRREEPVVTERLGGVEVVGNGDGGSVGLAAELLDTRRPAAVVAASKRVGSMRSSTANASAQCSITACTQSTDTIEPPPNRTSVTGFAQRPDSSATHVRSSTMLIPPS